MYLQIDSNLRQLEGQRHNFFFTVEYWNELFSNPLKHKLVNTIDIPFYVDFRYFPINSPPYFEGDLGS